MTPPPLDPRTIQALASTTSWSPILVVERTGSTNADLLAQLRTGRARPGTVLIAAEQVSGRGRLERAWSSPPGTSVALSAAVAYSTTQVWYLLPLVAGLAVARAGRDLGAHTRLKWPNDVLLGDRKWCGILVETTQVKAPGGSLEPVAVVGLGLNVSQAQGDLPVPTATSLALSGVAATREQVVGAVLGRFDALLAVWRTGGDLLPAYRAWSATLGQRVTVTLGDTTITGQATDIAADGRLGVTPEGTDEVRYFAAGDIEHLRTATP